MEKRTKQLYKYQLVLGNFNSHLNSAKSKFIPTKKINPNNMVKRNFTIVNTLYCLIKNKRYWFKIYKKHPS